MKVKNLFIDIRYRLHERLFGHEYGEISWRTFFEKSGTATIGMKQCKCGAMDFVSPDEGTHDEIRTL